MKKMIYMFLLFMVLLINNLGSVSAEIYQSEDYPFSYLDDAEFTMFAMGEDHAIAVDEDNSVYTWGSNQYGKLGTEPSGSYKTYNNITENIGFLVDESVVKVGVSRNNTFVLTDQGRLFICGLNSDGQIGNGTTVSDGILHEVSGNVDLDDTEIIVDAVMGERHTLVRTSHDRVFAWGSSFYGQFGNGDTGQTSLPIELTDSIGLLASETVTEVYAGRYNTAFTTSNDRLLVTGNNNVSQLGDGTTNDILSAYDVTSSLALDTDDEVIDLSFGLSSTILLTKYNRVFVTGDNFFGQLGTGDRVDSSVFLEITDNFNLKRNESISSVEMSKDAAYATTNIGRLFAWGSGAIGDETVGFSYLPYDTTINIQLEQGDHVESISSLWESVGIITSNGNLFTWGANPSYTLGPNRIGTIHLPIEITSLVGAVTVEVGLNIANSPLEYSVGKSSVIYLTDDYRVYTWGRGVEGQLGNGILSNSNEPNEITYNFGLQEAEYIKSVETYSDFMAALSSDNRLFMWGSNSFGQLGDGTNVGSSYPIDITNHFSLNESETIDFVSLGEDHSSMVTSENRVFMWGSNSHGQLGIGTTDVSSYIPLEITSSFNLQQNESVIQMVLAQESTYLLTSDGRVFSWGGDTYGQLGNGAVDTDVLVPTEITNEFSLAAGDYITLIEATYRSAATISNDGEVHVFGFDSTYHLLASTPPYNFVSPINITSDISLPSGDEVVSVSLGWDHMIVLSDLGLIYAVGQNDYGQLGIGNTSDKTDRVSVPVSGVDINEIISIEAGDEFSTALTVQGNLYTWGNYEFGQLCRESISTNTVPLSTTLSLEELTDVYSIYAEKDIYESVPTITVSVFFEYDIKKIIDTITINSVEYSKDEYTYEYGRLDVDIDNIWKAGSSPIITVNSYTTIDGETVVVTGNNEKTLSFIADDIPPTFDLIQDQTIEAGVADIDWTIYIINEQDNDPGVLVKEEVVDQVDYDTPGSYDVTVKLVDVEGNETSQTFSVIVEDTTSPVVDGLSIVTIEAGSDPYDWTTYIAMPTDNSDGVLLIELVEDRVDYDTVGNYTVDVGISDESGNQSIATIVVSVEDTMAPMYDLITSIALEAGSAEEDWETYVINVVENTDSGYFVEIVSSNVVYDVPGIYIVEILVSDFNGNNLAEEIAVTVEDTTPPSYIEILELHIDEDVYTDVEWGNYIVNLEDNSSGEITFHSTENVQYDTPGEYSVTLIVEDESGNQHSNTFIVIVDDRTPPTFDVEDISYIEVKEHDDIDWTTYVTNASDNFTETLLITEVEDNVIYDEVGNYSVKLSVIDEAGNETSRTIFVQVENTSFIANPSVITSIIFIGSISVIGVVFKFVISPRI